MAEPIKINIPGMEEEPEGAGLAAQHAEMIQQAIDLIDTDPEQAKTILTGLLGEEEAEIPEEGAEASTGELPGEGSIKSMVHNRVFGNQ